MEYIAEVVAEVYKARKFAGEQDGENIYEFDQKLADSNVRAYFDDCVDAVDLEELKKYQDQKLQDYNDYFDNYMIPDKNWDDEDSFRAKWRDFAVAKELYKLIKTMEESVWADSVNTDKFIKACFHGDSING